MLQHRGGVQTKIEGASNIWIRKVFFEDAIPESLERKFLPTGRDEDFPEEKGESDHLSLILYKINIRKEKCYKSE